MEEEKDYSYWIYEVSPDEKWFASFEDDGRTGYMYLGMTKDNVEGGDIHDHLWIYNMIHPPIEECKEVFILWSEDSKKAALIVDEECWGMFDLKSWRKMNAPRIENRIESIPREAWGLGVREIEGKPIKQITQKS